MIRLVLLLACLLLNTLATRANTVFGYDDTIDVIVEQMITEIEHTRSRYDVLVYEKQHRITYINQKLRENIAIEEKVELLILKDELKEKIRLLKEDEVKDLSKIRYLKGVQIIKTLYEKVLSLDHHFASVRTFSEINKMANPNQYPEFEKVKELVKSKKDKKQGFDLTSVLGTNTIVSVVNTFSNMLVSGLTKEEKETELKNIECIIDFTLRMQGDLNTIYFETAYLQKSNEKIKEDIEQLFKDYTSPIGFTETLENCRKNDNWNTIYQKTNEYLSNTKTLEGTTLFKSQVNIIFPIDRLLQFITQYNSFIDQGSKFYEKFKIILNSYENEQQCQTKLPMEYQKLKNDIDVAINKFNVAYKPVEVNGSKMKEILYGLNEYE